MKTLFAFLAGIVAGVLLLASVLLYGCASPTSSSPIGATTSVMRDGVPFMCDSVTVDATPPDYRTVFYSHASFTTAGHTYGRPESLVVHVVALDTGTFRINDDDMVTLLSHETPSAILYWSRTGEIVVTSINPFHMTFHALLVAGAFDSTTIDGRY